MHYNPRYANIRKDYGCYNVLWFTFVIFYNFYYCLHLYVICRLRKWTILAARAFWRKDFLRHFHTLPWEKSHITKNSTSPGFIFRPYNPTLLIHIPTSIANELPLWHTSPIQNWGRQDNKNTGPAQCKAGYYPSSGFPAIQFSNYFSSDTAIAFKRLFLNRRRVRLAGKLSQKLGFGH